MGKVPEGTQSNMYVYFKDNHCLMDFFSYTFQHEKGNIVARREDGLNMSTCLDLEDNLNIGQIVLV